MAELNDSPCSSDHDEDSDPLEANAGARLSIPEKAGISGKERCKLIQHHAIIHPVLIVMHKEANEEKSDFGMWAER